MDMYEIFDKSKSYIVRLEVIKGIYDIRRPYIGPQENIQNGIGFIVDIENGYVVTTANLVENCITIIGYSESLGKRQMKLNLQSICRSKNLALCQIESDDVKLLTRNLSNEEKDAINVVFGDNLELLHAEQVYISTILYPHEFVSMLLSHIVNFHLSEQNVEDALDRGPSLILLDTNFPIPQGSPVLNGRGEVVGITIDGTDCRMIPSRTFLAIMHNMKSEKIVHVPTFGLNWINTNRELIDLKTKDPSIYGIYIRNVSPDSFCSEMKEGDIIQTLIFYDPFWNQPHQCKFTNKYHWINEFSNIKESKCQFSKFICYFDRYGYFNVNIDVSGEISTLNRKLTLSEIADMLPIGAHLKFELCRENDAGGNWFKLTTFHKHLNDIYRLPTIYPSIHPYDYEIFAGLLCMPLDTAHLSLFPSLQSLVDYRYNRSLIIVRIFPHSLLAKTQTFCPGLLLSEINKTPVSSLRSLRKILALKPPALTLKTSNKSFFVITLTQAIDDDKLSQQLFNLPKLPALLSS